MSQRETILANIPELHTDPESDGLFMSPQASSSREGAGLQGEQEKL